VSRSGLIKHCKYVHIDHIEIRNDKIHIEFSISIFKMRRYRSKFLYRISSQYDIYRAYYLKFRYRQNSKSRYREKEIKREREMMQMSENLTIV